MDVHSSDGIVCGWRVTVYMQLRRKGGIGCWRINDAHHMFSSWCMKGRLEQWDSRMRSPRGRGCTETEIEKLIWYSSYAGMPVLAEDSFWWEWVRCHDFFSTANLPVLVTHTHTHDTPRHISSYLVRTFVRLVHWWRFHLGWYTAVMLIRYIWRIYSRSHIQNSRFRTHQ